MLQREETMFLTVSMEARSLHTPYVFLGSGDGSGIFVAGSLGMFSTVGDMAELLDWWIGSPWEVELGEDELILCGSA